MPLISEEETLRLSGKADFPDSGSIRVGNSDSLPENAMSQVLFTTGHIEHRFNTHRHSKKLYSDTFIDQMPTKECGETYVASSVNTLSCPSTARNSFEQDSTRTTVDVKQRADGEAQPCPKTAKEKVHEHSKEQKSENTYSAGVECHRKATPKVIDNSFSLNPIAHNHDIKLNINPYLNTTKLLKTPILETTDFIVRNVLSSGCKETFIIASDKHSSDEEEQVEQLKGTEECKKKLFDAVYNACVGALDDTGDMDQSLLDERYKEFIKDLKYGAFYSMLERSRVTFPFICLRDHFSEIARNRAVTTEDEMRYEGLRLSSFDQVNMSVSYLRLAAAGFYATGTGDETRCFSCGVTHRNWQTKDNPHNLHSMISPNCTHVTGTDERNVPIHIPARCEPGHTPQVRNRSTPETRVSESASNGSVPSELLGAVGTSRNPRTTTTTDSSSPPSYTAQQTARNCNDNAPTSVSTSKFDSAVHPHYSNNAVRLKSFEPWPEGHSQRPEDLVNAGFFYAGYADCVRCFVCGVGLKTWEEGDDPWVEHVRWRSSCAYVEAARGMTFVLQTLAAIGRSMPARPQTNQQQSMNNMKTQNNSEEDIMRTDACQRALGMGFTHDEVRNVAETIANGGTPAWGLDVLLENILAMDGDGSEQTASAQRGGDVIPPQVQTQTRGQAGAEGNKHGQLSLSTPTEVSRIPDPPLGRRHVDENEDIGYMSDGVNQDARTPTQHAPQNGVTRPQTEEGANMGYNNNVSEIISGNISPRESTSSLLANGKGNDSNAAANGCLSLPVTSQRKSAERMKKHENNKEQLMATKEETQQLKESSGCKICLEEPANIVFLPCGHLVACAVCSPALERCPICRAHIRGTVRVHLADMVSREKHIDYG